MAQRSRNRAAASAPSPAPAPAPAPTIESSTAEIGAAPEGGDTTAPSPAPSPAPASEPAVEPATAEIDAATGAEDAIAAAVVSGEPIQEDAGDVRYRVLGRAHSAIHDALDALDEVARSGAFAAATPAEQVIVATAQRGFDAIRKAMADTEEAIGVAVSTLRYEGLERRAFVLVKDVLLDGTAYGPSAEEPEKPAPLTEDQHAELLAAEAIETAWDDGDQVEAD